MSYETYIGKEFFVPKVNEPYVIENERLIPHLEEYRLIRMDEPKGFISHEKHYLSCRRLVLHAMKYGFWKEVPKDIDPELMQHVQHFRRCLQIYDMIVEKKVISIEEIYERCLLEGPKYAKFIKKSRAFSLQAKVAIETLPESEYIHEEYSGYDSIFHERYLIYWDDSEETVDWPYSLLEVEKEVDIQSFKGYFKRLMNVYDLKPDDDDLIPISDKIANKKSSLNVTKGKKTTLLKNTWGQDTKGDWFATRAVVPTSMHSTRDTGVPDIETLVHLKKIHKHVRKVCEKLPFSANCSNSMLHKRMDRIREGYWFIHIDFKKFGLTARRDLANAVLECLGLEHLKIPDVYLFDGEDVYKTVRGGGSLGWLDPLFSLVVITILYKARLENKLRYMDFISFNDDIEVCIKKEDATPEEIILIKDMICTELDKYDFLLSYRKIYCSRMMVFLEEYDKAGEDLPMYKLQLCVGMYANSLTASTLWKAKMYYSEAHKYVQSVGLKELCMNSIRDYIPNSENVPIEIGGWTRLIDPFTNLNYGLRDCSIEEMSYFLRVQRYKEPHLMPKWVIIGINDIERRKYEMTRFVKTETRKPESLERDDPYIITEDDRHRLLLFQDQISESDIEELPPPLPGRRPLVDPG